MVLPLWVGDCNIARHRVHIRARFREAYVWFQTTYREDAGICAAIGDPVGVLVADRCVGVAQLKIHGFAAEVEISRHDADQCVSSSVEAKRFADDQGRSVEFGAPELLAEHQCGRSGDGVVIGREVSPNNRPHAEQGKKAR